MTAWTLLNCVTIANPFEGGLLILNLTGNFVCARQLVVHGKMVMFLMWCQIKGVVDCHFAAGLLVPLPSYWVIITCPDWLHLRLAGATVGVTRIRGPGKLTHNQAGDRAANNRSPLNKERERERKRSRDRRGGRRDDRWERRRRRDSSCREMGSQISSPLGDTTLMHHHLISDM